jgi:2'-5' RNA ligase
MKNFNQFLLEKKKEKETPKDCVMLGIDINDWKKDYLDKIEEDDIYDTEDKDYGLETMPHVTVVYGLLSDEMTKEIKEEEIYPLLENIKPFELSGVSITSFENDDFDVLKIDVEPNKELLKLRKKLLKFPNEQTYKDYHPHITISYLKKGTANKYIKKFKLKEPIIVNVTESIYSNSEHKKKYFELN